MQNKEQYPVEKMCKYLKISRNAYYNWLKNKNLDKTKPSLLLLKEKIKEIFYANKEIYGSARIQQKLEREGLYYSASYIARIMKEMGLRSILRKKYTVTTHSNHKLQVSENKLNREFSSTKLGEKWVSDITYIRVGAQWNYLTTIMDLADRKIVGWNLSEDMTVENTIYKTWVMARNTREISDHLIFHSDRGVQFASHKIRTVIGENIKITQSMSNKGDCWDNAVAESFFKTIKYEWVNRYKYNSFNQANESINEYIKWYNNERLHSTLGYLTPLEMQIKLTNQKFKYVA